MPFSLDSVRSFAHLTWLLVYRPLSVEEQKRVLREAIGTVRGTGLVLSLSDLNRSLAAAAQLEPLPAEMPWLTELSARMAGHAVVQFDIAAGVTAADLLGVARVLATQPVAGDEGANFDVQCRTLQLTTIDIRLGRAGFLRRATPVALGRSGMVRPAKTPALGIGVVPTERLPVVDRSGHSATAARPAQEETGAPVPPDGVRDRRGTVRDEEQAILTAALSRDTSPRLLEVVLQHLAGPLDAGSAPVVLDELSRTAEDLARDGAWEDVAGLLRRMVAREGEVADPDVKRAFVIHLRRLFKPGILRGVAQFAARRREWREGVDAVFERAGDMGADMLIELMVASNVTSERRAYRSMVAACPRAAEPLRHLLDDARWYVVRNAAELLGEMGVQDADAELIGALRHSDARVRRAAAGALARLGTARGVHAVQGVLGDRNAAVRLQAVHGLASARLPRSVPALLAALDKEDDAEIQHALLHALGAHPTDAAVAALSQAAQPGTLLHRKTTAFRVAAVHALGEAGTPTALAALRQLQSDKDREVRAASERALAAHAQGVRTPAAAGRS
ncbi:MAG TPA: HEAT repeat domain-containing protein [Gemmatimonadaceae bacterium]|nr:HEAT repeat domain-containing protein [Gemmatimonadaceae bacterium]